MSGTNEYDNYIPGTCNIGNEEIAQRRMPVIVIAAIWIICICLLQFMGAGKWWRLITFLPAAAFGISVQQLTSKFCIAYGMKGLYNFGEAGKASQVQNAEFLKKDKEKVRNMILSGILFGLLVTVIYFFV